MAESIKVVESLYAAENVNMAGRLKAAEYIKISARNSGGPLIDSYGHIIGVSTTTFTRKGTGASSGVNFAIPIDTIVRTVPYLIVYGTPYRDRF
ncbi:hypothetical protein PRUPE_8G052500 [Prunus persica]|uniref:Peptidase S1 domain-containing protein n=1 Tax=Prunus persica TaxID=3760 RepID=M5VUY1_PRUPE|nr:hypothetical protein PRUPE_8G052500 [Prunus persica]